MLLLRTKKKSLQQEWLLPASNNYHHHHRQHHNHNLQQPSLQILLVLLLLTLGTQTKEIQAQPVEGNVGIKYVEIGQNVSIKCETAKNVTWLRNDKQLLKNSSDWLLSTQYTDVELDSLETELLPNVEKQKQEHLLTLPNFQFKHNGSYSCRDAGTNESISSYQLEGYIIPRVVLSSSAKVKQRTGKGVSLYCVFEVYPHNETLSKHFKWLKDDTSFGFLDSSAKFAALNATHVNLTLDLAEVYKKENGSYACVALTLDSLELARRNIDLLVMDVPQATIDYVKAVGADKIYMNWTINDGNDPIQKIFISYSMKGTNAFTYYKIVIGGGNTSFVLDGFKPNTEYLFRISAKNSIGDGQQTQFPNAVRTLEKDPEFIPQVESTGSTASTITIGWNPPPLELLEYIQYYELVISEAGEVPKIVEEAIYPQNSRNLPYMFDNLKTATEYEFKVRACSDLTKLCGNWSRVVNGTTMDGVASEPTELQVSCIHQNISRLNSVVITWNSPTKPNGKVVSYLINLVGRATYRVDGREHSEQWGPKMRRVDEPHHKAIYEAVQPNTRYTVNVSAITRHRKNGEIAVGTCEMPVSVPESIARANWIKVKNTEGQSIFKLYVPKVSERNGAICCYRLYLIRMGSNSQQELPPPEQLSISTYHEVHAANNTLGGAYIADMLPGDLFRSEVFLGDGKRFYENDVNHGSDVDAVCRRCLSGQPFLRKFHAVLQASSTPIPPHQSLAEITQSEHLQKSSNLTEEASKILQNKKRRRRRRRHPNEEGSNDDDESQLVADEEGVAADLAPPIAQDFVPERETVNTINALPAPPPPTSPEYADVFDGEIDMNSNYTGFLEVIVRDKDSVLYAYSPYFDVITPITAAEQFDEVNNMEVILTIAIHMLAILIGIVLVLLFILCSMHHFNRKNTASDEEAISLRDSLRAIFTGRSGGQHHRHFIGNSHAKSTDWAPIKKSDIHQAYKNRHKDTDYGFLREYELLPNRFSDRTTKNSDLKENASKNRYPDIKAYDQTRVKLSQLNGLSGSDYINANFVIGYKERKKFICAQGPMESTIQDFWRMIWEQHLEIIIMLTNLEEYNKSKCARYWPEKVLDTKKFGEITVKYAQEKKLGDYLIRIFDICKRSNAAGGEHEDERRQITQYHYLEWKDFMAPEHPHGIIKFIRHINAAYSVQRGPILVHCSAGVGRTGTLVALDSLMQQLDEEEQVSIYNTVCDLRHQRNFLVQSLKQYIFLYRALMDVAYFGNTELSAVQLSATIEALKTKPYDGKDKCKLEVEFEKLIACVDETMKSCSVGSNEDNMCKNRNSAIIPYDRNRVILTPIPMKDNTTYINASFIEGYDSQESYIITQDPLENTIGDFWRMVSEQSISTLVMISEIGDGPGKCPRYWADDEIQYDHILVKYVASESCPYYTRREFNVTNCKIDDTICVTQFQYNGWPTVEGEVPEVCRGIIELVDQAQQHHAKEKNIGCRSPLTVHCSCGTDRSSIFVAMCILVKQLRFERSVDICSTARKIRSQRSGLLDTYAQYEFLHRAIANYADLHKLSTSASIEHQSPVQQQQPQQSSSSTVQIE